MKPCLKSSDHLRILFLPLTKTFFNFLTKLKKFKKYTQDFDKNDIIFIAEIHFGVAMFCLLLDVYTLLP